MAHSLEKLYNKIGYTFKDVSLIEAALSHRSVKGLNNERLEFLGDSILNFIIAEALYHKFPEGKEGELSRLRAHLVRGETLTDLAKELDLGDHLRLGPGEMKSGGFRRSSILADAVEAVIAAVYIDIGMESTESLVRAWYETRLASCSLKDTKKDAKTCLQEYLQGNKYPLPTYTIANIKGDAHNQMFLIACTVEGLTHEATGTGTSRRKAEQEAAENYLALLEL